MWSLRRKDTLGTALLSFFLEVVLFMKYLTFNIMEWNVSNVARFVHELVCNV